MTALPAPIEAATNLAPLIRDHADVIERERRLPGPVVRALTEAGVFRLFIPRALGGAEVDPMTRAASSRRSRRPTAPPAGAR